MQIYSFLSIIVLYFFIQTNIHSMQRTASRLVKPGTALVSRQAAQAPRIATATRAVSTMPQKIEQQEQRQQQSFRYKPLGYAAAGAAVGGIGLALLDDAKKSNLKQQAELENFKKELDVFLVKVKQNDSRSENERELEALFNRFDSLIKDERYVPYIAAFLNSLLLSGNYFEIKKLLNKEKHREIFNYLQKNISEYGKLFEALKYDTSNNYDTRYQFKNISKYDTLYQFKNIFKRYNGEIISLSRLHLSKVYEKPYSDVLRKHENSFEQLRSAMDKEESLIDKGYICFFHSQQQEFALLNDVITQMIYQLAQQEAPKDFLFLRLRYNDLKRMRSRYKFALSEILNEQDKLMEGPSGGIRKDILALNLFAYGNTYDKSSSTATFLEYKENYRQFESRDFIGLKLKLLGVPDEIIKGQKEKIEGLIRKANDTYRTSLLMLIAVPANIIDDSVYSVIYSKKDDDRIPITILDKEIHQMSELIEKLYTYPSEISLASIDPFECAMPLTPALALNPDSGIKIFKFDNPVSKQAELAFEAAKKEFVNELIKLLKESWQLKKSQTIAKDYLKFLKDVHNAEERNLKGEA